MPQNLMVLRDALIRGGIRCKIEDFNVTKKKYESFNFYGYDFVGIGFVSGYWPHEESKKIAGVINSNKLRNKFKFIIGGHAPSAAPEYYKDLLGADSVFVGPAERFIVEWATNGMHDGIFKSCEYDTHHSQYNMLYSIINKDLPIYKRISFPNTRPHEFAIQLLSGRGCPYNCNFCFRMDGNYRPYPIELIVNDVNLYATRENISHFQFSDELLMINPGRLEELCERLVGVQEDIGRPLYFDCNGRLNFASKHPEILVKMFNAGFRYINYGCESMSQEVLDKMNKKQTVEEIEKGIENTLSANMSPGLNFMWGCPGDTIETLDAAANFIINNNDGCELRTVRPMTPYPGTKFFKDLGITVEEFYKKHVNSDLFSYHFMDMSNRDADLAMADCNERIVRSYHEKKLKKMFVEIHSFYSWLSEPSKFRGFREV